MGTFDSHGIGTSVPDGSRRAKGTGSIVGLSDDVLISFLEVRSVKPSEHPQKGILHELPFVREGKGDQPLLVVPGLTFENKTPSGMMTSIYRFLREAYTIYCVMRRPNLPEGVGLRDMADDYANFIEREFNRSVDVIGLSTGGSIVQHLAADHPERVRRLVIHSSAHTLSDKAKKLQLEIARLGEEGRWWQAYRMLVETVFPECGIKRTLSRPIVWLATSLMAWDKPSDAHDLVATVKAEDQHAFKDRLGEITAPTLVIAGMADPFYSPALFRETASGIPGAELVLYEGMGHPASGKDFEGTVLRFLTRR